MWKLGAVALGGVLSLVLAGSAAAATPATTTDQISVNGSGGATVAEGSDYGQQQASYDQALTVAITDAQTKAQAVATQLALTLGPVVSFTEESVDYLGYCGIGIAPGFAATGVASSPSTSSSSSSSSGSGTVLTPIPTKPTKHKSKKRARTARKDGHTSRSQAHRTAADRQARAADASSETCKVEADVTIVYSAS